MFSQIDIFLLATDLDGTLLGDEYGETIFRQFTARQNGKITLAYVTGRYRWSVIELIEMGRLPRPRFICSDVGTDILDLDDPCNHIGQAYAAQVPPGWDLEEIYNLGLGDGITRQEFNEEQPRYQAGFYWDARPETFLAFKERFSRLKEIYIQASYNRYIDVLPTVLGKGNAVRFLQTYLGLAKNRVVVAGDSGNDRQMFETSFNGIIPNNALDELKAITHKPWHYHSLYPAACGVLDGLHHFGLIKYNLTDLSKFI